MTGIVGPPITPYPRHRPTDRHPGTILRWQRDIICGRRRALSRRAPQGAWDRIARCGGDDEQTGCLFSDWEPEDVAALDAAIGHHPTWAVTIDISGRIDGTPEVHQVTALLLEHGGVAVDDYSAHPWTLQEIESGTVIDGLRFFDFRAYHELHGSLWRS
jgi:hypothetical protein